MHAILHGRWYGQFHRGLFSWVGASSDGARHAWQPVLGLVHIGCLPTLMPALLSPLIWWCIAGGYLGADSAAFFSSVNSGAAGSYLLSLTADAGISTELTIRPGQVRRAALHC